MMKAPVRASLDMTYACDLRCIHCRTNTGEVPLPILRKMMSLETLQRTVRDLDEMGTFEITLTGGEPTIAPHFWELIEDASRLRTSSITLITNAAEITREQMDRVVDSGIRSIRVSIDGTREKYAEIRLKDRFDQVIENCHYWAERVANFKILTTIMSANVSDVFDLVELLRREGFKRQDLILVRAHGRGMRNDLLLDKEQIFWVQKRTEEFQARVHPSEFELRLNAPYLVPEPPERRVFDVVMYPYLAQNSSIAISATGDVTMSRLYSPEPIGNVKLRGIRDIWIDGQSTIAREIEQFTPDELRELFWSVKDGKAGYTALLDRQIFENAEVI